MDGERLQQDIRIMVVFAHADDAEFTSGGTIARWVAQGHEVTYVVCTDGCKGADSAEVPAGALSRTRREEQLAAAETLGVQDVLFLDYPDGELERVRDALRMKIIHLIRRQRPHRVVTWDPWRPYQLHRDHTAAGYAAFYAAVESSVPDFITKESAEAIPPHQVDEVYLFGTDNPDTWVDVSDFVERKREAIRCHESQVTRGDQVDEQLLAWNQTLGRQHNGGYAEIFKVLRPHCEICR